ncbi:hypothetical protein DW981_10495 [Clostridium sp. AM49-4BH]|nr:hypothetical protein DW981_10495 [Clostridium sp. AM49-4BH]
MKEIYHLRWGIETSFRELKYAIGLTSSMHENQILLNKKYMRDYFCITIVN